MKIKPSESSPSSRPSHSECSRCLVVPVVYAQEGKKTIRLPKTIVKHLVSPEARTDVAEAVQNVLKVQEQETAMTLQELTKLAGSKEVSGTKKVAELQVCLSIRYDKRRLKSVCAFSLSEPNKCVERQVRLLQNRRTPRRAG